MTGDRPDQQPDEAMLAPGEDRLEVDAPTAPADVPAGVSAQDPVTGKGARGPDEDRTAPPQAEPAREQPQHHSEAGDEPPAVAAQDAAATDRAPDALPAEAAAAPSAPSAPSAPPAPSGEPPLAEAAGSDAEEGSHPAAPPAGRRRVSRRLLAVAAVVAAAAVLAGVLVWAPWRAELPDGAAFRAAGTVVTEAQVQRRTEVLRALYGVQVPEEPDRLDRFRRDTAKAMAISMVLDRSVDEAGIRIADKTVSDALDRFLERRYPQGRAAYVQALSAEGVGEQDVLDEIRRQLEIARLFDSATKDVTISDQELQALFEADPAAYAVPERRRIRHIVVPDGPSAQAVLRRLQAGEDFAPLAADVSRDASTKDAGGDLGLLAARDLDPRFAAAAFAAGPGKLFGPVQTPLGWHVGRVDQILPGAPTTFDQVRDQLREQQETERRVAAWRTFIVAELEDAEVIYAQAYRPADPQPDLAGVPTDVPGATGTGSGGPAPPASTVSGGRSPGPGSPSP